MQKLNNTLVKMPEAILKTITKIIPQLSGFSFEDLEITRLAGLTNQNYFIATPAQNYVLRIPREATNSYINRSDESHNSNIAQELLIAPKNVWRGTDELAGSSLTEFIQDASEANLNDKKQLEDFAKILSILHDSQQPFKGLLDNKKISKHLTQYFSACPTEQQKSLKDEYEETLFLLESPLSSRPSVPSHIDLVAENILLQNEKMWLIDWEYSAMASPFWDIATVCNANNFNVQQSEAFLKMMLQDYKKTDLQSLRHYQIVVKTISDCWQAAFTC